MEGYEITPDIDKEELDDIFKQIYYDYITYGTASYFVKPEKLN